MTVTVVVFEETGEEREVTHVCIVCLKSGDLTAETAAIVSPRGVAHAQHDWMTESTACGHNATGDGWWWRL